MSEINIKNSTLTLKSIQKIENIILSNLDFRILVQSVVDDVLLELNKIDKDYKIIVLTLINKKDNVLERISLSQTKQAALTLKTSKVDFHKIEIPLNDKNNKSISAIKSKKMQITHDFKYILGPALNDEDARKVQNAAGIKTSIVLPLNVRNEVIGTMIFSKVDYSKDVTKEEKDFLTYFTNITGMAVQNSLLYSQLEQQSIKLKKANSELKELDKQKDEFISIASHELKTPISIAKNNLWMFKYSTKTKFSQRQEKFLSELEEGLDRLQVIVNNLLDISRIQQKRLVLDIEEVDIYELVMESIDNFNEMAKERNIEIRIPDEIRKVICIDKNRTSEVIDNFISNAIKYSEKGIIRVKIKEKDDIVKVSVKDAGPGISNKDKDKIFTKFGRATEGLKMNNAGASTGLGLYISKKFIEAMGGEIGFTSKKGQGTEFWFTLSNCETDKK